MLFQDKEYRFCANCAHAAPLDGDTLLCGKKGVVSAAHCCAAFRYDPLRRTPPQKKPPEFSRFQNSDFSL